PRTRHRWPAHARWRWPRLAVARPRAAAPRSRPMPARQAATARPATAARTGSWNRLVEMEFGMFLPQPQQFGQQHLLAFRVFRIRVDAFNRADDHALRLVEMPHALGAAGRIDHIDG